MLKFLPGLHWDFFDHHTILTEASLAEVLEMVGFQLEQVTPRFLPYTLVNAPKYPLFFLRIYLALPWLWWIKGRQFLVIAAKTALTDGPKSTQPERLRTEIVFGDHPGA